MNREKKESPSRRKAGRPLKINPAVHKYSIRFNADEHAEFLSLFEKSGMKMKAHFITSCIFGKSFKVLTVDKNTLDFYNTLKEIKQECRKIGVNYNQYVVILRTHFTPQRAVTLSAESTKLLQELLAKNEKALQITLSLVRIWLPK